MRILCFHQFNKRKGELDVSFKYLNILKKPNILYFFIENKYIYIHETWNW
jgi:hypothetical protein